MLEAEILHRNNLNKKDVDNPITHSIDWSNLVLVRIVL